MKKKERRKEKENFSHTTRDQSGVYVTQQEDNSESEEAEGPEAFEDNPMPILKGAVKVSDGTKKVKILYTQGQLSI